MYPLTETPDRSGANDNARMRPSRVRATLALGLSCTLVYVFPLGGAVAHAQDEPSAPSTEGASDVSEAYQEASRLRREAEDRFFEEDYDAAIEKFEQAYAVSPHPTDLFNMGRIHEEKGELELALKRYEEFVAQPKVSLDERGVAAERIKVLRVLVKGEGAKDGSRAAATATPTVVMAAGPEDRNVEGRAMIISGSTLTGVGALFALGGGVGFGIAARKNSDKVDSLSEGQNPSRLSLSEAENLEAEGKDLETFQIVSIAAGSAVALVGIGLLTAGLLRRRAAGLEALVPTMGPRFAGVSSRWRF